MEKLTIDLKEMAHGGSAVGRANRKRTVFVPGGIPGEKVRVEIHSEKNKYVYANLVDVLQPSPDRVEAQCVYFGVCGGCHFQHMNYAAQLLAKQNVTIDQMLRIGNMKDAPVVLTLANPEPWGYRIEMVLSPTDNGRLGFWSPLKKKVIPIESCPITRPELVELLADIDLEMEGLRKLTLRLGDDDAMLAAIEVDDVEPPELETDFPVSVAIVLPDKTSAALVGDNFSVQAVQGRDFRVSPGCYFAPNAAGMALMAETVLRYADLSGQEMVLDLYSGVGVLTAFLAEKAKAVIAVEMNADAVADTAVNLADTENVSVYEGFVEDVLPQLDIEPDVIVLNPTNQGITREATTMILEKQPSKIIYVSSDVATFARDGRKITFAGYNLKEIQPIDMRPQTFHIDLVAVWELDQTTK